MRSLRVRPPQSATPCTNLPEPADPNPNPFDLVEAELVTRRSSSRVVRVEASFAIAVAFSSVPPFFR
jgi:hypothetical protein